jgi:hypothetical protein
LVDFRVLLSRFSIQLRGSLNPLTGSMEVFFMKNFALRSLMIVLAFVFCTHLSPFLHAISHDHSDTLYLHRIHPNADYHLTGISQSGDIVQLHDGSTWYVYYADHQKVRGWVQSDNIFIKRTASYCFPVYYKYIFHNRTLKQIAHVKLKDPITINAFNSPLGVNIFYIVKIDIHNRLIQLNDHTIWFVDPKNNNFTQWKVGERILVGVNNKWRTETLPLILINADRDDQPYTLVSFYRSSY